MHIDPEWIAVYQATVVDSCGRVARAFGYGNSNEVNYVGLAEFRAIRRALLILGYDR